jgi:hypothetical protein
MMHEEILANIDPEKHGFIREMAMLTTVTMDIPGDSLAGIETNALTALNLFAGDEADKFVRLSMEIKSEQVEDEHGGPMSVWVAQMTFARWEGLVPWAL